jgi:hypothetical protein
MFGGKRIPLAPRAIFATRLRAAFLLWLGVIATGLAIGIAGYHWIAKESWLDSFLNASMILGGMGQVSPLETDAAKAFAGFYALFAGLAVIGATAVMISPILHRMMHRFHLEDTPERDN